jgi:2'-hydroxyisoflavone reductase
MSGVIEPERTMPTRRDLLAWAATVATLSVSGLVRATSGPARKPLDLLFLGGTGFLGPHQVEHALARGHRVTLFNRGKSAPGLYGDRVEVLTGNRDARIAPGLSALEGSRRWDAVIDNSGYVPRHVADSLAVLKGRFGRYLFVSTVAVYDPASAGPYTESSPLRAAPAAGVEEVTGATYGPLKAECDRIVRAALGDAATTVRPTYIVGPGDDTDRFTYWVERMALGGEVLGPPEPSSELQWVDVRDLCPWIIELVEQDKPGIFNAAGPAVPVNWEQVLRELARGSDKPANLRWATREVLERSGVRLPLVRATAGSAHFSGEAAQTVGLRYRPLADTAAATLAWWRSLPAERRAAPEGWPTAAQEQEALRLLSAG